MAELNPFDVLLQSLVATSCRAVCMSSRNLVLLTSWSRRLARPPNLRADTGANPDAFGRVLRLLSAHGVFEVVGDSVRHSPASRLLRSDHPQSMRAIARMLGLSINWNLVGELEHAVRTGLPALETVHPEGYWAVLCPAPG